MAQYDLVFCDGDRLECLDYLAESLRLLRPGGLVCFEGVFANGRTVDSAAQPTEVLRVRELLRTVRESTVLVVPAAGRRRSALRGQAGLKRPARPVPRLAAEPPEPPYTRCPGGRYRRTGRRGSARVMVGRKPSADDLLQSVAEGVGLVRCQLDDEPTAAFERNAHDDAPPLLGHLERAVARPRLHGRHARSPS
ncbi:hypothetical protein SANTM175S_10221 [Streptomyces antimycoticus]